MKTNFNYLPYQNKLIEQLDDILFNWDISKFPKTFFVAFLREYLLENNAWTNFRENFRTVPKRVGFSEMYDYIIKTKDISCLFEFAFLWGKTKEGTQYWDALNNGFNAFLDAREEEGFSLFAICKNPTALRHDKGKIKCHKQHLAYSANPFAGQDWYGFMKSFIKGNTKVEMPKIEVPITSSTINSISIKLHKGRPSKAEIFELKRYKKAD